MKLFLLLFISCGQLIASDLKETDYFASLRANEVNVRAGPGSIYPIKYTFFLKSMPVRVISEYDNWSKIEDLDGEVGWINQNLITKKRTLITQNDSNIIDLYQNSDLMSKVILNMENNVILDLVKCDDLLCEVKVAKKRGWVTKEDVWGLD